MFSIAKGVETTYESNHEGLCGKVMNTKELLTMRP